VFEDAGLFAMVAVFPTLAIAIDSNVLPAVPWRPPDPTQPWIDVLYASERALSATRRSYRICCRLVNVCCRLLNAPGGCLA
jgi:hypothetical protein